MKCDRCRNDIPPGDDREYQGNILCEDCYMVALSPPKACDPWAVYSAKSFSDNSGETTTLTEIQQRIVDILAKTDGIEPELLAKELAIPLSELEREMATLRHMEKVRAKLRSGRKVLCSW